MMMAATFIRLTADGGRSLMGFAATASDAHDSQFLSSDPNCRIQLRALLRSDMAGLETFGTTAMLVIKDFEDRPVTYVAVMIDRTRIRNTREGVMHAINRLARVEPGLSYKLRTIANHQTAWAEPD